jgi:5-methylcytosine-specific restriction protein B
MARIREIVPGSQEIRPHKAENAVTCQYQIVNDDSGDTLLHISTFGSESRESKPKSSQSIQLDRENAIELIAILRQTFGLP